MTQIYDNTGCRWVESTPRKRRKSPRAVRFAAIKVGDQLMRTAITKVVLRQKIGDRYETRDVSQRRTYYLVTDSWFDPVAGQNNHVAGEMVGIVLIGDDGVPDSHKQQQTKRGLASQGFHYADRNFIAFAKQRLGAEGVVGIEYGVVIRRRPKVAGAGL